MLLIPLKNILRHETLDINVAKTKINNKEEIKCLNFGLKKHLLRLMMGI